MEERLKVEALKKLILVNKYMLISLLHSHDLLQHYGLETELPIRNPPF